MTSTSSPVHRPGGPDGLPRVTGAGAPSQTELLIRGAAIVSVDPHIGELDCGDILVRAGAIAAIGPDLADRSLLAPPSGHGRQRAHHD